MSRSHRPIAKPAGPEGSGRTPTRWLSSFLAMLLVFAAPLQAQQRPGVDTTRLIDALAEQEMVDLLTHLQQQTRDPVEAASVEITLERLRSGDASRPIQERHDALDRALAGLRRLIADHPQHPQRPLWQTDLADLLLTTHLMTRHQAAPIFVAFGVASPGQVDATAAAATEALEHLQSAAADFEQLQATLPRQEDFFRIYLDTGLWHRMTDDYAARRTPFFFARAAQMIAALPKGLPANDGSASRTDALRSEALQAIEPLTSPAEDAAIRIPALNIQGGLLLSGGDAEAALASYQQPGAAETRDIHHLVARVGVALSVATTGDHAAALARLTALESHPAAQSQLLYRLLVTDVAHAIHTRRSPSKPPPAEAFASHLRLLEEPALRPHRPAIEHHVFDRWARTVDPTSAETLPPLVRLGIAEGLRRRAQAALLPQTATASPDASEAARQLLASARLAQTMLNDQTPRDLRARAQFNLGLARYLLAPQDTDTALTAAAALTAFAREAPAERRAEEAIAFAVQILRHAHGAHSQDEQVIAAYQKAADVLLQHFPTTAAADNERLYLATRVLRPMGRHRAALDILDRLPVEHPDHAAAQIQALQTLEQLLAQAEPGDRIELRRELQQRARRILDRPAPSGDREAAQRAQAAARLALAAAAMDAGELDAAIDALDGFEQAFAAHPALVRQALQRRFLALAQAGRLSQLDVAAREMMNQFPDHGAAVVNEVLTQLDARIGHLRERALQASTPRLAEGFDGQAQDLAATASQLAALLTRWAQAQDFDEAAMLPYQLIHARSLRLAGQLDEAQAITADLANRHPQSAPVLHERAEVLSRSGDEAALRASLELDDRIISGLQPPYPDLWWNAWTRRLQTQERLGIALADIPLRVRQLRQVNADLGGEPFRTLLTKLERRHADAIAAPDDTASAAAEHDASPESGAGRVTRSTSLFIGLGVLLTVAAIVAAIALNGRRHHPPTRSNRPPRPAAPRGRG